MKRLTLVLALLLALGSMASAHGNHAHVCHQHGGYSLHCH